MADLSALAPLLGCAVMGVLCASMMRKGHGKHEPAENAELQRLRDENAALRAKADDDKEART